MAPHEYGGGGRTKRGEVEFMVEAWLMRTYQLDFDLQRNLSDDATLRNQVVQYLKKSGIEKDAALAALLIGNHKLAFNLTDEFNLIKAALKPIKEDVMHYHPELLRMYRREHTVACQTVDALQENPEMEQRIEQARTLLAGIESKIKQACGPKQTRSEGHDVSLLARGVMNEMLASLNKGETKP